MPAGPGTATHETAAGPLLPGHPLVRPLWLLTTPRPLRETNAAPHDHEGGPLSLLAGPERIEAGWWDGQHVARDYFVARNQAQALLWIYRERDVGARWYVHGFFFVTSRPILNRTDSARRFRAPIQRGRDSPRRIQAGGLNSAIFAAFTTRCTR